MQTGKKDQRAEALDARMVPSILIYEDHLFNRLYPLSITRPVYLMRCGIHLVFEKIARRYPQARLHFFCRNYLAPVLQEQYPKALINTTSADHCLLINGRFMPGDKLPEPADQDMLWRCRGDIVAASLSGERLKRVCRTTDGIVRLEQLDDLPTHEVPGTLINYLWDLVQNNTTQITEDFSVMNAAGHLLGKIYSNVALLEEKRIFIGEGAKVYPGVVLDAEGGPICIDAGATIMPNAVIQGPCFVGAHATIKIGAKIYHGTSIGERCKVGGEVEASILHGFSNKQHEGFLGHSYLGQWTNIGANANNSDLKNNYGTVKVYVDGEMVDSGLMYVGLAMGDHAKCGINTMFNTGSVVGVMSNVFGAGYSPKLIPSFVWGGIEEITLYDVDKAIDTARRVMQRRGLELSAAQEEMLREVFVLTEKERTGILSAG